MIKMITSTSSKHLPFSSATSQGLRSHKIIAAILILGTNLANAAVSQEVQITKAGIGWLDWVVISGYMASMVLVGWLYSRRTKTTDDYLLGGRAMRPWAVGLSLFATLLSTITYLALPGETIKYGPMIITQLIAYPFIIVVVGWFVIPRVRTLNATSAYEILEQRLGLSVRMLGSFMFLILRLMWMAVIIYATTNKVLIPLFGWPQEATPWVCAILGTITVAYTSMGGLRAVVFTDVLQTFILFGGAVIALLMITVKVGGVGNWWPAQWASNWDKPVLWFDTDARVTVASAALAAFIWFVCTSGSDQMAIQRYLATRDTKAARRMYIVNMLFGAIVQVFLVTLGFALLAYFRIHPELLPTGESLTSGSDRLFTHFIVFELPMGVTGLVIAGLLAAAMSSLSSGVNSSCAVITVDFIARFRPDDETDHVRLTKVISWVIGAVVVLLSCLVSFVEGNLLEITFKVSNLLTVPLFILFFVAIFVPWGTAFGAWTGCIFSSIMAVGIAFFEIFGLNFLWIMPGALVAGITVGMIASVLPVRSKVKR